MRTLFSRMLCALRQKTVLIRIISLYLAGSIVILLVFSGILSWYLTKRTTKMVLASSQNSINQAYNAANFILSDAYNSYYKLYNTIAMQQAMFDEHRTVDDQLELLRVFDQASIYSSCVESIYVVNRAADIVYTNQGAVTTVDAFYDKQALRLFEFYNENSTTVFLPRNTSFSIFGEEEQQRNYVTLIFARKNSVSTVMGGLIVNINESKLHELITAGIDSPQHMYIVASNGSILSHSDSNKINTTLQGTSLWETIQKNPNKNSLEFETIYNDIPSLVTYKNANKLMFSFIDIIPKSEVSNAVSYISTFVIIVFMVFLAVAFVVALICGKHIYSPIEKLVTSLRIRSPKQAGELAAQPLDEFSFLDKAYESLKAEVYSLSSSNEEFSRAKMRETLIRLLQGEFTSEESCREKLAQLGTTFTRNCFTVVNISFDSFVDMLKRCTQQDIALFKYAILNVANELFAERVETEGVYLNAQYITMILCSEKGDTDTLRFIKQALTRLNCEMKKHLQFTVSCGIGTFTTELKNLQNSYKSAFTALSYRLVEGQQAVIAYTDIALRQSLTAEYPLEDETAILQAVRNCNYDKASVALDSFFSHIALANADSIQMAISQLSITLSRVIKSLSVSKEIENEFNYRALTVKLSDVDCLSQRKMLLLTLCHALIDSRTHEVQSKKEELISGICEFIKNNYANPLLSVEDIASYAQLSVNYLRTLFKTATGKSPSEYLSDLRIERACEFLETTNYTTKEIASAAGYYNHRYFYSVFKGKLGITATEYRRQKTGIVSQEDDK